MDKPSAAEGWIRGQFKAVAKLGRYGEQKKVDLLSLQNRLENQIQAMTLSALLCRCSQAGIRHEHEPVLTVTFRTYLRLN
jgi:hypothetical protein